MTIDVNHEVLSMRVNILVAILMLIGTSACSLSKTGTVSGSSSVHQVINSNLNYDVLRPHFIDRGNRIEVVSENGSHLFEYRLDQIVDLDRPGEQVFADLTDRNSCISIINAAIVGSFEAGDAIQYGDSLVSGKYNDMISKAKIGRPLTIKNLRVEGERFFLVPILWGNKLVAASLLKTGGGVESLQFIAETKANSSLGELPAFDQIPGLSLGALETVARNRPSYVTQDILNHSPERVYFDSNQTNNSVLGFFFWRGRTSASGYYINAVGQQFVSDSYETQSDRSKNAVRSKINLKPV